MLLIKGFVDHFGSAPEKGTNNLFWPRDAETKFRDFGESKDSISTINTAPCQPKFS